MSDLYICTGQYHVFCSLLLKMIDNKDRNGTLVICDIFENAKEIYNKFIYNKTERYNIFEDVILIDRQEYENLNNLKISKLNKIFKSFKNHFFYPKSVLNNKFKRSFERIYIAGPVGPFISYCIYECRVNSSEIYLFDDGLGPRISSIKPNLKAMLFDWNGGTEFYKCVKKRVFFSPERICNLYPNVPIIKQCKLNEIYDLNCSIYNNVVEILNYIFSYCDNENPFNDNDIIYFSSGFDIYKNLSIYSNYECDIINKIGKNFNRYVVKRHPNSKELYNNDVNVLTNMCMPEILFLNTNIEEKLLISSTSTSVFNPSFVFDKEPYIILTYKLFGSQNNFSKNVFYCSEKELEKKISISLYSGYRDKYKIYVPKSYDELILSINDYLIRTNKNK